jgi:hypothetical protein
MGAIKKETLARFFSRCSSGDSGETRIPFGNDKQRKLRLRAKEAAPER